MCSPIHKLCYVHKVKLSIQLKVMTLLMYKFYYNFLTYYYSSYVLINEYKHVLPTMLSLNYLSMLIAWL